MFQQSFGGPQIGIHSKRNVATFTPPEGSGDVVDGFRMSEILAGELLPTYPSQLHDQEEGPHEERSAKESKTCA